MRRRGGEKGGGSSLQSRNRGLNLYMCCDTLLEASCGYFNKVPELCSSSVAAFCVCVCVWVGGGGRGGIQESM